MENKIKFVANAVRWFDKVNGNTYHSVNITNIKTGKTIYCPMTYGYSEQYRHTALEAMAKAGWLPEKYRSNQIQSENSFYMYERENNYPIMWNVTDGLKRDCVANGKTK
jgi:hypothetical protein